MMFNGNVIEIKPTTSRAYKAPTSLLEAGMQAIERDIVDGVFTINIQFTPRDLINMSTGEHTSLLVKLANAKLEADPVIQHYLDQVVCLTRLQVTEWRQDSPFFLEVGTPQSLHYAHLMESVSPGAINIELKNDMNYNDVKTTLLCPAIFYKQLKTPTNIIEQEIFDSEDNAVTNEEDAFMFGPNQVVTQYVEEYSFLDGKTITGPTVEVNEKGGTSYVFTPLTSLVGLAARRLGSKYPLVWDGTDFEGKDNYLLKIPQNIYNECLRIIKEHHLAVDRHARIRLSELAFGVKASTLFTQWNLDENTRAFLYDRNTDNPACNVPLDEVFTLTLRVHLEAVALNPKAPNRYAMVMDSNGVFFFPPYPKKAVGADGKILPVLDEFGKVVYVEDNKGRRVVKQQEPFNIPVLLGPRAKVDQLEEDHDRTNIRRSSAKRMPVGAASSSTSNNLCDDD